MKLEFLVSSFSHLLAPWSSSSLVSSYPEASSAACSRLDQEPIGIEVDPTLTPIIHRSNTESTKLAISKIDLERG